MTSPALDARVRADARMDALLPRLVDVRRRIAALQADEARLLAEAREIAHEWAADACGRTSGSAAEMPHRSVAAEIGAACRASDRTVQRQMGEAATLVRDFPETLAALDAGDISVAHARVIVQAGTVIERPELLAEYEQTVLDVARCESAARLAPIARRRAEWFAESTFEQRHHRAAEDRGVWVTDLDDGVAEVRAVLPAVVAHGIHDRLSALARAVIDSRDEGTDDERTTAQVRADVFADMLLATDPVAHNAGPTGLAAIRASVRITVPVLTLIDDRVIDPFDSAALEGHCPIDPAAARLLTANAPGWDRVLTHPISGQVLSVDRYRPSEEQRRHLRIRDQHCRFPGCRMPPRRCDADHTVDAARGGPTRAENLALLCRRHHSLKHQTGWSVRQEPGGVLRWQSPSGRSYADVPVSTVAFVPDPEAALETAPF